MAEYQSLWPTVQNTAASQQRAKALETIAALVGQMRLAGPGGVDTRIPISRGDIGRIVGKEN